MKALCLLLLVAGLAGCGEDKPSERDTRLYGPEAFKVAGDTAPWSNAPFNGDQKAWTEQEEKRARLMNEYSRIR
jgi:predicted small lipoprotein YifL